MINKNGERELCYVVKVDDIQPIQGRDVDKTILLCYNIRKKILKGKYYDIK